MKHFLQHIKTNIMKTYILQTESGFFLSENNEWNHIKHVSDIKEASRYNYNDAVSLANLHFQISDVKTKLIKVNSEFC